MGFRNTGNQPRGCFVDTYDNKYYFNPQSGSTYGCDESDSNCVCAHDDCTACNVGFYSPGGENARCTKCGKGEYTSLPNQISCKVCEDEKFSLPTYRNRCLQFDKVNQSDKQLNAT